MHDHEDLPAYAEALALTQCVVSNTHTRTNALFRGRLVLHLVDNLPADLACNLSIKTRHQDKASRTSETDRKPDWLISHD